MKVLYYLCCALSLTTFVIPAHAAVNLSEGTSSSQKFQKLSDSYLSSISTKYAGVSFISSSRKRLTINDDADGNILSTKPIEETKCEAGKENVNGACINVTDCKAAFPLTSASKTIGFYVSKDCGSKGIGYCYSTCQAGWYKSGDCECKQNDCSGFVLETTVGKNCNGTASCKSGETYVYKCTDCAPGYKLNGARCVDKVCGDLGANYSTTIVDHCTSISVGKIGETYCYMCSTCEDGYTVSGGTCIADTCSYSKNASIANCIKHSVRRTGLDLCYECTECENGYSLNDAHTVCSPKTCSGGSTSLSTGYNCSSVAVTKVGTGFCYKCQ